MKLSTLGVSLLLFLLLVSPVRADSPTVSGISKELICQCGCTLVLANCNHDECMSQDKMTTLIEQKIAEGQSSEQIIQFFVAQYGEEVLASPPKRGFNLTAWILPFAVILGGGGIIYIALKKWVKRGKQSQASIEDEKEEEEEEEKYHRQLEKELEDFTEEGFR